ncbi:hypothetical protein AKUG0406_01470 [Apilactobacillus kunkeei]|nr:hypothetical protein AKUG0406_01470 [Apilactobacillus kunkeei]CAI2557753.1 hypothetical protein AKUG0403_01470 [Apilactobacillus kunkeei]CAI2558117.1 hypothetical protein AKUG0420_01500 [Apilactobacillus kunkeei]
MKESNDTSLKVSNYWKKALYSSVVLGAIFVGGQYVNSVNANADTVANTNENQSVQSQVLFNDVANNNNLTDPVVNGYVGQQSSLVNAKTKLQDLGYDVSDIPDTYTPTSSSAKIYSLTSIGTKNEPSTLNGQCKLIFEIFDQNGNYIESKYDSTNNSDNYDSTPIVQQLQQEKDKFVLNGNSIDNGKIDIPEIIEGTNVINVSVTAPTHTLTINYVNQNGANVFTTNRQVTNYGHTDFKDDEKSYGKTNSNEKLNVNSDQPYVANNQSTATVNVTTTESFNPDSASNYSYAYPEPDDITTVSDAKGSQNPNGDAYYTNINVVGADGKNIVSLIVGSNKSQFIATDDLGPNDNDYNSLVDFNNVTDLPGYLDLTKGPYTFHSSDTLAGLQAQSNAAVQSQAVADQQAAQSAPASQSNQAPAPTAQQSAKSSAQPAPAPAPKPAPVVQSHPAAAPASTAKAAPAPQPAKAKPSKSQLKAVDKSCKQSKHAVKTDTAKLKALKKKMKKHATKKQKAAYKALQIKLAADKKAVKSYKAQEGKLTKYFKEVAVINRDNKQIKSLTAQLKKLKKKHSKANKKKAAKVQKALKKANNSLKVATKFVNDYK